MPDSPEDDIFNKHGVSMSGAGKIAIRLPPRGDMSKHDALVLAAWLVSLADPVGDTFQKVLDAVQRHVSEKGRHAKHTHIAEKAARQARGRSRVAQLVLWRAIAGSDQLRAMKQSST